jgi:hypothetical protein
MRDRWARRTATPVPLRRLPLKGPGGPAPGPVRPPVDRGGVAPEAQLCCCTGSPSPPCHLRRGDDHESVPLETPLEGRGERVHLPVQRNAAPVAAFTARPVAPRSKRLVLHASDSIDPEGSDYGSTVNKAKAFAPDAIFYGGYYAEAGKLLKATREKVGKA